MSFKIKVPFKRGGVKVQVLPAVRWSKSREIIPFVQIRVFGILKAWSLYISFSWLRFSAGVNITGIYSEPGWMFGV